MTRELVIELLELQRRGIEPYFTIEGGAEFFRMVMELEDEVEASA